MMGWGFRPSTGHSKHHLRACLQRHSRGTCSDAAIKDRKPTAAAACDKQAGPERGFLDVYERYQLPSKA